MFRIDWRNWKAPRADFWHVGIFWPGSDKFESWKNFHTFTKLWHNCHIFECVRNHINADISHPITDRNVKTYTLCFFMLPIGWPPQITNMQTLQRIISSSWCFKIWKKFLNRKFSIFFSFLRHEVPFKANNNRKAVVVCARHVVKRPSKRSVLVYIYTHRILYIRQWRAYKFLDQGLLS